MRLTVTGRYQNGATAYDSGQVIDVTDAEGELLMRDSPGTFVKQGELPAEETASQLRVPDRRARGGQRR